MISKAGRQVQVEKLNPSVQTKFAMEPSSKNTDFLFPQEVKILATLDTNFRPFDTRNLPFLAFKHHNSEVVLSPLLPQSIGFVIPESIKDMRNQFQDAGFSTSDLTAQEIERGTPIITSKISRIFVSQRWQG